MYLLSILQLLLSNAVTLRQGKFILCISLYTTRTRRAGK